jgi:general stress protein YciG
VHGAATEGVSPLHLEPSVATRKGCKGTKKNGVACTAWATEGGLCYFHANPDKASELGKRGGKAKSPTGTPGVFEYVARPLKSVDDVTKLLADTINDLRSGAIDSRLANTVGYLATGVLMEC